MILQDVTSETRLYSNVKPDDVVDQSYFAGL